MKFAFLLSGVLVAAAWAGGDIKWTRSEELPFISPDGGVPAEEDLETIRGRYTLQTKGGWFQDIREIKAILLPWAFFYYMMRSECKKHKTSEAEYTEQYERTLKDFNASLCFEISIKGKESMEARLQHERFWEVYLDIEGEKIEPQSIKPLGAKRDLEVFRYTNPASKTEASLLIEKGYSVFFKNPFAGERPKVIKLVLLGEKCRRGFEWRFKEE
jgi:hypothetical protein